MKNRPELERAHDLYQQGDLPAALAIYRELLLDEPNDVELLHAAAALYAQTNDTAAALQAIDKAIDIEPEQAMLYNSRGNILKQHEDINGAIEAYQHALSIDPEYAIAYNNLGNAYRQLGKLNDAREAYSKALALDPNYVDANYNVGLLLAKLGEYDQAINAMNTTLKLNARHAGAHGQLAEIYLQQLDFDRACEHFEYRLTLQPEHADSYHGLGQALLQNGKIDGAIEAMQKALSLDDKLPECYQHLGNAYILAGDPEKALNLFMRQLEIDPLPECHYNIGVLLSQQNRHREAIDYLERAAEVDPSYLPTHLNLGALYLKMNAVGKAVVAYQAALELKPDDEELQHIITALQQSDTPEKAPEAYVQHLFDQYATFYDKHLMDCLKYQVPAKIFQAISEDIDTENVHWTILDLGCGTGLCGAQFRPLADQLIGIDVSAEMVAIAKEKNIYTELAVEDAETALSHFRENDLILAADVFTYIGKLDKIFELAKAALKQGGIFAFSVEKTFTEPYVLQQTIRYAHSKKYLDQLIADNAFDIVRFDNLVLRENKRENVEGYLVALKNTPHPEN